uniref:Uncharacterized protein n=1 Tax=Anguilla anguilla TaxID=7936 RepID=A0A0E9QJR0_ANGAN
MKVDAFVLFCKMYESMKYALLFWMLYSMQLYNAYTH